MQYFEQYQNKQLQVHAMGLQYFGRKRLTERLVSVLEKGDA
ncbi:hypothetical protein [Myroides odoratus]